MKSAVNLNRLGVFAAVVEAGSFTGATARLGLTKAMVSQHVRRLEAELGVTLLNRTTRQVTLTSAGQEFYVECTQILSQAESAIARAGRGKDTPSGTLRITTAGYHGIAVVVPALAEFMERYPQVHVDMIATDRVLDPVAEGLDLSIRTGWPTDSSFRATRLATFQQHVVASSKYLARHPAPRRPEDLRAHRFIALSSYASRLVWTFTPVPGKARGKAHRVRLRAPVQASTSAAVRAFVLAGAGVAVLADFVVTSGFPSGQLIPLLTNYTLPEGGIYAVYPMARPPAKVRMFIDFFREYLVRKAIHVPYPRPQA